MATIIDGNAIAAAVRAEVKERVAALKASRGIVPGLATVLVGDDPGSAVYVRNKRKACEEVGMTSFGYELPATASEAEVVALVQSLAGRADVHGILTQLPMPKGIREELVLGMIPLAKDVDGFHPSNIGLLGQKNRRAAFAPCTPPGVHRTADPDGGDDRRKAGGGGRAKRDCGVAGGADAAGPRRDRDLLPQPDGGPACGDAGGRHPDRGDREAPLCDRRHGQAGSGRD